MMFKLYLLFIIIYGKKLKVVKEKNFPSIANKFYGLIVVSYVNFDFALCYDFETTLQNELLVYNYHMDEFLLTTNFFNLSEKCQFQVINTNDLFLKVITHPINLFSQEITLKNNLYENIKHDNSLIPYINNDTFQQLDLTTSGIYAYLSENVDIKTGLINKSMRIIFMETIFTIGFITDYPDIYDDLFVRDIRFRNNIYTIVANNFYCSSVKNIKSILHHFLIVDHHQNNRSIWNDIINPCLPIGYKITLNQYSSSSNCAPNDKIFDYSFIGAFNMISCEQIINKILENGELCKSNKGCNFFHVNHNLINNEYSHILLTNQVFECNDMPYHSFIDMIDNFLDEIILNSAYEFINSGKEQNIIPVSFYQAVFLKIILKNNKFQNVNYIITAKKIKSYGTNHEMYLFTDKRIGVEIFIPSSSPRNINQIIHYHLYCVYKTMCKSNKRIKFLIFIQIMVIIMVLLIILEFTIIAIILKKLMTTKQYQ